MKEQPLAAAEFRLGKIRHAAERVRHFGQSLNEAHSFGVTPGHHGEPWCLSFHRIAVPVYSTVLPWSHLTAVAAAYRSSALAMAQERSVANAAEDWLVVSGYLWNAAFAMDEAASSIRECSEPVAEADLREPTPIVTPFAHLAALCTHSGAERLRRAGAAVAAAIEEAQASPLKQEEVLLLAGISRGERVLDVARCVGLSERAAYRCLSALWRRLGVSGRAEGLSLCIREGWLEAPRCPDFGA